MKWLKRGLILATAWRLFGPVIPPRWKSTQVHPWRVPARTYFVGDRELSVREAGPMDGKPVVLIHGLAGSSMAEWYKVAPILAASFRLVMIDHRSHGLSYPDRSRYEISDLADDIADIIKQLGLGPARVGRLLDGGSNRSAARPRPSRPVRPFGVGGGHVPSPPRLAGGTPSGDAHHPRMGTVDRHRHARGTRPGTYSPPERWRPSMPAGCGRRPIVGTPTPAPRPRWLSSDSTRGLG